MPVLYFDPSGFCLLNCAGSMGGVELLCVECGP